MPKRLKISNQEYKSFRSDPNKFCDELYKQVGAFTLCGPNGKVLKVVRPPGEVILPHKNGVVNVVGTPLPANCECAQWAWVDENRTIIPRESDNHHKLCAHAEKWNEMRDKLGKRGNRVDRPEAQSFASAERAMLAVSRAGSLREVDSSNWLDTGEEITRSIEK